MSTSPTPQPDPAELRSEARARAPWRVPALVLCVAAGVLALGAWLLHTSPAARLEREKATLRTDVGDGPARAAPPVVSVDGFLARAVDARLVAEVSGVLEPVRSVVKGAELAGAVVEVAVEENARVEAGDLLVRLDPALAEAAVERARAATRQAEAAERLARAELRRQQNLSRGGVNSAAELDRAETEARRTAARVAEARAQLLDAETRLAKTRIEAPFAGVVHQFDLEPGAYLQPGQPVAEIVDLSEIEIEVGVSDRQILALEDGAPVRVAVDVYPGEWFEGRILRRGRAPDAATKQYAVPVRIANSDERLLPGMLGRVRFELGDARPTLRVPRRAVLREFELDYVYTLEPVDGEDGVALVRRRLVQTRPVPFRPDLVEVRSGLESGRQIAISGLRELREGLRVRVRSVEAARDETGA
ncbi:MAG: efflux RND transporter periplasmic adaptor subunit [Deltaproteobacteria bacterium]|nr:MAG: efflux RND transporter periplasmic adaptor subunit [Deltaproteobacteria bacterium]